MSLADLVPLVPLVGTVGAACGALGGAIGAWLKGRAQAETAKVVAEARETVATQETERVEIAARAEHVRQLLAENAELRKENRGLLTVNTDLRVLLTDANSRMALLEDDLRASRSRLDEAERLAKTLREALDKIAAPAVPTGSD